MKLDHPYQPIAGGPAYCMTIIIERLKHPDGHFGKGGYAPVIVYAFFVMKNPH
jgi:hypothetical protein